MAQAARIYGMGPRGKEGREKTKSGFAVFLARAGEKSAEKSGSAARE